MQGIVYKFESFAALSKALDEAGNTGFSLTTMGEVLPRFENHARIDPNLKDEWGIASLHISHKYTDNEHLMARDATVS